MNKKLFVGGLDRSVEDQELNQLFSKFGDIEEAVVIKDRYTGRSKFFGFVTYKNEEAAQEAINNLDGSEHHGRKLVVNVAHPPKPKTEYQGSTY